MPKPQFSQLEKAIISAICYYDIFDYPLTSEEIWRWLYTEDKNQDFERDLNSVLEALEMSENLKEVIETEDNYYFLKDREEIVETRKKRFEVNKKKWKITRSALRFMKMAPFLKYVAVCNNLAFNNTKEESDIDFFIVTEPGHLWSCRLSVTWFVFMLGYRRSKTRIKDKICLSFYMTEDNLDFRPLMLPDDDPYFVFWIDQLVPLYDRENVHYKIQKANEWVKDFLPNAFSQNPKPLVKPDSVTSLLQKLFEATLLNPVIGDRWEGFFRGSQLKKMEMNKESAAKEDNTKVVISDYVLKFHEGDKRGRYREEFYRRLKEKRII